MGRTRANRAQGRMPSSPRLPTRRWLTESSRGGQHEGISQSDSWAEAVARLDPVYILASSYTLIAPKQETSAKNAAQPQVIRLGRCCPA